ncbi:MAG: hypothetical protein KAT43_03880 [Nanoarchaeota archaeon]|nr:hypothetical protein [Nanoarchaeota archaeon]
MVRYPSLKNMPKTGKIIRKRKVADGYILTIKSGRKEYQHKVAPKSQLVRPLPGWDGEVAFNLKPDTGKLWNVRRQR